MTPHILPSYLLLLILILSACGGNDDVNARVVYLSLDDRTISVGESSVVSLGLEYNGSKNGPFDSADDISLVVRLPAGTKFREGTAEIQRSFEDKGITPNITNCIVSGEEYLNFRLDGDDLISGTNPSGSSEAEVTLTLDAIRPFDVGVIQAKADRDELVFACGAYFSSDAEDSIQVVP